MSEIYKSISAIMADIGYINKNRKNTQQGFKFRGIDDVYNALHAILAKHKVFTVPEVLDERTEERKTQKGGNLIYRVLKIKYTFYAVDGSSVSCFVIGEGMDSGDKAGNKAMAVAHKYALLQTFCIPTEEEKDPDAETPPQSEPKPKTMSYSKPDSTSKPYQNATPKPPISQEQLKWLNTQITKLGINRDGFKVYMGVSSLKDVIDFEKAKRAITAKEQELAK